MRTSTVPCCLIMLAAALTACSDAPTTPTDGPALRATPIILHLNEWEFTSFNYCPEEGEWVDFSGKFHSILHTTQTTPGSRIRVLSFHLNFIGTGQETGNTYRLIRGDQETKTSHAPFPRTSTFKFSTRIISRDGSPTLVMQFFVHVTRNANGETTADIEFDEIIFCR